MELVSRELLSAGEAPEQQIAARRDGLLGKHNYRLVLLCLFEVDTPGCCQVSLTTVTFTTCPVTLPLPSRLQRGLKAITHLAREPL